MQHESVAMQLEKGKAFFSRKYPEMKYLAYFQSYTNTHGKDIDSLRALYLEAIGVEDIVGLVIGTRPDTLPDQVLDLLEELNRKTPVFLEIGAETSSDATLQLINRRHTWQDVENAVNGAAQRGIRCGLHLIAGLPGEDREQSPDKREESLLSTHRHHQAASAPDIERHHSPSSMDCWRDRRETVHPRRIS